MTNPDRNINVIHEWLKASSSGAHRPSAHAVTVIEEQESELTTLRAENAELRANLEAMETELAELRAYKEAAEGQKPSHVIDWEYDDDTDDADARGDLVIHQLNGMEYQRGTKLYARPVPSQQADKPVVAVPGCFMKLYDSARGMRFGTDWNMGTAARNHRRPLIEATWECETWLSDRCPRHESE